MAVDDARLPLAAEPPNALRRINQRDNSRRSILLKQNVFQTNARELVNEAVLETAAEREQAAGDATGAQCGQN